MHRRGPVLSTPGLDAAQHICDRQPPRRPFVPAYPSSAAIPYGCVPTGLKTTPARPGSSCRYSSPGLPPGYSPNRDSVLYSYLSSSFLLHRAQSSVPERNSSVPHFKHQPAGMQPWISNPGYQQGVRTGLRGPKTTHPTQRTNPPPQIVLYLFKYSLWHHNSTCSSTCQGISRGSLQIRVLAQVLPLQILHILQT